MFKQSHRKLSKFVLGQDSPQADNKLEAIIKTFRQNHLKLMQKIEECDKKRQIQHEIAKKKVTEKFFLQKIEHRNPKIPDAPQFFSRPFSQLKSERTKNRFNESHRKQNLGYQSLKRHPILKEQDYQQLQISPFDEQNIKIVKVNLNKLVPLSIEKLKQKMKML